MTKSMKELYKKSIELLYKLIESKPNRAIFKSTEIMDYINRKLGKSKLTHWQFRRLHIRQLKYYVFKRPVFKGFRNGDKMYEFTEYIYVKIPNWKIAKKFKGAYGNKYI